MGFGGIVGVQLLSDRISSERVLALGVNASLDLPVYQTLYFTFSPAYIHGVRDGADLSEVPIAAGFSLSL